jgi:hypothetical protein
MALMAGAALLVAAGITVQGSSHREAPGIAGRPRLDGTEFYTFRSYEPGRQDYVRLTEGGMWMVRGVHMIPSPARAQADWVSY